MMISERTSLKTFAALLFLFLLICFPQPGRAERDSEIDEWNKTFLLNDWEESILEVDQYLFDGSHSRAQKLSKRVMREIVDYLGTGPSAEYSLAVLLVLRSLAETGLGNEAEALWYWHVALGLYPEMAEGDLSRYGESGKFLAENVPPADEAGSEMGDVSNEEALIAKGVKPPRALKRPKPKYPSGARLLKISGKLVVQVVIDEQGVPRNPKVVEALPTPALTFAALEALKRWEFEPGEIDGKVTAVYYNLHVNYGLRK